MTNPSFHTPSLPFLIMTLSVGEGNVPFGRSPMVDDVTKSLCGQIKTAIELAEASGQTLAAALLSHVLDALDEYATS